MTPAPLQFLDYWATSIRMDACRDYDPDKPTEFDLDSIKVDHEVKPLDSSEPEKNGTRWLVGLTVEQTANPSANLPYTFSVSLQGLILALPGLEGERLDRAIRANGPAMLFGVAREMIRAATGRGPHNAVIIPSTNFLPAPKPPTDQVAQKAPTKGTARKTARKGSK